jgi:hypothetical protein
LTRTAKRRRENWIESRLTLARRHWREGVVATAMATGLWVHSVPGVTLDRSSKAIPVVIENLPEGYRVSAIEPAAVDVEFEGTRRDLAFAAAKEFQVRVDGDLVDQGRRTFSVDADQVEHPPELRVVDMKPVKVRLSIDSL